MKNPISSVAAVVIVVIFLSFAAWAFHDGHWAAGTVLAVATLASVKVNA